MTKKLLFIHQLHIECAEQCTRSKRHEHNMSLFKCNGNMCLSLTCSLASVYVILILLILFF